MDTAISGLRGIDPDDGAGPSRPGAAPGDAPVPEFRELVERLPGIAYVEVDDLADPITYLSPRIEDALGYRSSDFLQGGRPFWESLLHPDDAPTAMEADRRSEETKLPYLTEYRLRHADGSWRWFRDEAHYQPPSDGTQGHWLGLMIDITERREAEARLADLEARYRHLVEQLPAVTYVDALDDDMTSIYVSPQIEEVLGIPAEVFQREDLWAATIHPEDRETAVRGTREGVASRRPFSLEYRMVRADGGIVWVHDQSSVVHDEHGVPLYIQGIYTDITQQKSRERELADAVARFEATVEKLPAIVYIEDPDCDDMHYVSPRYEEWFGYSAQERMRDPGLWQRLLHPEDRDTAVALSRDAERTGADLSIDYRMVARDGTVRWIHDETTLVRDPKGHPMFWLGIMLDVTDRREAEQELRETAVKFQTLVERLPAVTYVDPLAPKPVRSVYVSPQIESMFGITAEDAMSDDGWWIAALHPEDRDEARRLSDESDASGRPFRHEYRLMARDGRTVWVRDESDLVRGDDGRPRFWLGVIHDITEQKAAESDLTRALELEQEAVERLRLADEIKNTFLTAVSHDLRTPLAAILGSAVTLEHEEELQLTPEDRRTMVHALANKARRLTRIVTDLLDMDRLSRGVVEPHRDSVDVGALVGRLVAESELLGDGQAVRLRCEPVVAPVDTGMLERIVENLLANTAKHLSEDAGVWIRVSGSDGGVLLTVEDDGPGVPEELRESLFRPFERGPSANPQSPGTGIGLSLVARFAELHGGRAWVQEREGGGASFRVWLPGDLS